MGGMGVDLLRALAARHAANRALPAHRLACFPMEAPETCKGAGKTPHGETCTR